MKISIAYPPIDDAKGIPLLSQNRQFQWFHNPTYIYPVVPAYAATLLNENGFEVSWNDGIASGQTFDVWFEEIKRRRPDLMAFEVKTPVIKRFWNIIDRIKEELSGISIVLMGDHVTALPEEFPRKRPRAGWILLPWMFLSRTATPSNPGTSKTPLRNLRSC